MRSVCRRYYNSKETGGDARVVDDVVKEDSNSQHLTYGKVLMVPQV